MANRKTCQAWLSAVDDQGQVFFLAMKEDQVFVDKTSAQEAQQWQKAIVDEEADPATLVSPRCDVFRVKDIVRAESNSVDKLKIELDGAGPVVAPMQKTGQEVVEAFLEYKGRNWNIDTEKKIRLWEAVKWLLGTFFFAAVFTGIFIGVETGNIDEIHWLFALLINNCGSWVLLAVAGLIALLGIFLSIDALIHPAEIWTLQDD